MASRSSSLMSFSRPSAEAQSETRFIFGTIVVVEHGEDLVELGQRRQQRRDIVFLDSLRVERGIRLAHHFENRGLRLRGVEVVVERGFDALDSVAARDCISGFEPGEICPRSSAGENSASARPRRRPASSRRR